uniref:Uncharacterized protein n=1 Tax=Arundo donax TaxID=35708 RepID=A0A0A9H010_ARUDO
MVNTSSGRMHYLEKIHDDTCNF